MSTFRVNKNVNYTVMSNHHLQDKRLSLKAKGLLSYMLSLPDDWDYSLKGLTIGCKDGIDSVRSAVHELEDGGYLCRSKVRDARGRIIDYNYEVFELPQKERIEKRPAPVPNSPSSENPMSGFPTLENPRLTEIAVLKTHIINYAKTREVYAAYRKAGYSKAFLEAHREEITLHKAAKAAFDEAGLQKLPKVKALDAEFTELLTKKKAAYPDYRKARNEMQELVRAQKNVERFFAEEKPAQENEQAR